MDGPRDYRIKWHSSVQTSPWVESDSLWSHELHRARPPCPSPTPRVYPNPCPLSWWCHPTISSSVIPFSSCPQSFPASGLFKWVSSSHQVAKVLEFQFQHQVMLKVMSSEHQGWSPSEWTGCISLQSKGLKSLLQHHSSKASILWRSAFFMVQLSHPYRTTGKTITLTRQTFVDKWCFCFLIGYLGWS